MFNVVLARIQQGRRTAIRPLREPALPERFRGLPAIDAARCPAECRACVEACPTGAVSRQEGGLRLDLGRCLFCTQCADACTAGAIRMTRDHRLAVRRREDLVLGADALELASALDAKSRRLFGRSLKLRQVSAAGCNACEADLNVLGTLVFDIGRLGLQFVASPRHADALVVTGPVSENMRTALADTYAAMPAPKLVIAVGACAVSGGPFADLPEVHNGCAGILPVDLFIPGCPPHPLTVLDGLLRLLGRLDAAT